MINYSIYPARRSGSRQTPNNQYELITNGFPKKKSAYVRIDVMEEYWRVHRFRRQNLYKKNPGDTDVVKFGKILA